MPPGSANLFKPEVGRNLNRIFPPQLGGFEVPQILSGVVNLTHDFPGTAPYANLNLVDLQGANDVVSQQLAFSPPDGFIWIVDELSVLLNNEPASRIIRLYVTYLTSISPFSATVTLWRQETVGVAATFIPYALGRRFVMSPGAILNVSVNLLTAGANIRMTFSYLQVDRKSVV